MEAEFIQYLVFFGGGPSSKTCPKWAPHAAQVTSVRIMPGRGFIRSKRFAPTNLVRGGVVQGVMGCILYRNASGEEPKPKMSKSETKTKQEMVMNVKEMAKNTKECGERKMIIKNSHKKK